MVWTGISTRGHIDLYFIESSALAAERYLHEILQPTVLLYAVALGEELIFIDDNARPHRVNPVNNWLEEVDLKVIQSNLHGML